MLLLIICLHFWSTKQHILQHIFFFVDGTQGLLHNFMVLLIEHVKKQGSLSSGLLIGPIMELSLILVSKNENNNHF